jgi:hypothetical protein
MNSMPMRNISLYIPHIFSNYTKEYVANVFENLKIGKVKYIDFIAKMGRDNKAYHAAYIHFEHWFDNIVAQNFHSKVLDENKEARVVYEDPWYWIVLENKAQKYVPGQRKTRITLTTPPKPNNTTRYIPVTPTKESNVEFDADFKELCRKIHFDDELPQDEIEKLMAEEDKDLITIDARYVETLEQENQHFRNYLIEYRGKSEFQMNLLRDEIMSLQSELDLMKQSGATISDMYY